MRLTNQQRGLRKSKNPPRSLFRNALLVVMSLTTCSGRCPHVHMHTIIEVAYNQVYCTLATSFPLFADISVQLQHGPALRLHKYPVRAIAIIRSLYSLSNGTMGSMCRKMVQSRRGMRSIIMCMWSLVKIRFGRDYRVRTTLKN